MRALDPEVIDAVWAACERLIPEAVSDHPLGCHRRRIPDEVCFRGVLIRLVVGCSWEDTERLLGGVVSDTTLRTRRDERVRAGVFEALEAEALAAYDRIVGLDLSEVSVDGSQHKAPYGGARTGKNPCDRGKLGIKWSIMVDRNGIPLASALAGANRHDTTLFEPTLKAAADRGLIADIETLHLDRGYDNNRIQDLCHHYGIDDINCARKRPRGQARGTSTKTPLGMRWTVERTNSWLTNYGQLRRNTDRHPHHRHAQLQLAITLLLAAKLIDWRNRWSPDPAPIR
ncbi:MAG: IS5 family transposase [bacterium]|nr:IS5 family transposase [bacterium]